MANESQSNGQQNLPNADGQQDDNQGESQVEDSSLQQDENDIGNQLKAIKEQLTREKDRNDALEQSIRLQERVLLQQQQTRQQPTQSGQTSPDGWTPELDVLEKALDPVFKKQLRTVVDPLTQGYNRIQEDNDALRFEMFLSRNNPELLDDEDSYNKIMQQVESIRQTARQRGMEVSRVDAFIFNEGLQGTKQRIVTRKQKKTSAVGQEARRSAEISATQVGSQTTEPRATANTGIQAIRDKANRGERLSNDERMKLRDFVSNVEI